MQKNKKHGKKYPQRPVIAPSGLQGREAWYRTTDSTAPLDPGQFAAGVIQHPETGLYQSWVSTNGLDVTCVSAHYQEKPAEADVQALKTLVSSGDLYDDKKTATLFEKLKRNSDEEPRPFPDELVRQITRAILRAVVDRKV